MRSGPAVPGWELQQLETSAGIRMDCSLMGTDCPSAAIRPHPQLWAHSEIRAEDCPPPPAPPSRVDMWGSTLQLLARQAGLPLPSPTAPHLRALSSSLLELSTVTNLAVQHGHSPHGYCVLPWKESQCLLIKPFLCTASHLPTVVSVFQRPLTNAPGKLLSQMLCTTANPKATPPHSGCSSNVCVTGTGISWQRMCLATK